MIDWRKHAISSHFNMQLSTYRNFLCFWQMFWIYQQQQSVFIYFYFNTSIEILSVSQSLTQSIYLFCWNWVNVFACSQVSFMPLFRPYFFYFLVHRSADFIFCKLNKNKILFSGFFFYCRRLAKKEKNDTFQLRS